MMTLYGGLSAEHLKQFIESIERFIEQKKNIQDDIKMVFSEAKSVGFDVPIMKELIKLRAKEPQKIEEAEYLLDTYKRAMGMIPSEE